MAITVKKKLTVKTVKAQGQLEAEAAPIPAAAAPQRMGRARVDGKAYTVSVVFAIIAILMFIGLITLQALELSFYYQPPKPVFIRRNALGGSAAVPSVPPPAASTTDAE